MNVELIERLHGKMNLNEMDRRLDELFEYVDDLFLDGSWGECNEFLAALDPEKLELSLLIGVLSITNDMKGKIEGRGKFIEEVKRRDPLRRERLLEGLW